MPLHPYQIIVLGFSAFMIYSGTKNFIKGRSGQNFYKLSIRIIVWGGMSLVALFPSFTNFMAKVIGLEGNMNAVILSGFLLIFLMIFKLLSAIEHLEQNVSELTRQEALRDISQKK